MDSILVFYNADRTRTSLFGGSGAQGPVSSFTYKVLVSCERSFMGFQKLDKDEHVVFSLYFAFSRAIYIKYELRAEFIYIGAFNLLWFLARGLYSCVL